MSGIGDQRENRKRSVRRNRRETEPADYALVDANKLRSCIALVAFQGGALRFGLTSDGGAYAIGIYGDGDPYTDYVKPSEDMNEYLDELYNAWYVEVQPKNNGKMPKSGS